MKKLLFLLICLSAGGQNPATSLPSPANFVPMMVGGFGGNPVLGPSHLQDLGGSLLYNALGLPMEVSSNTYTNNTGTITNQIECTIANCPAGKYLAIISLSPVTTAALGSISLNFSFTDVGGAQTVAAISALLLTSHAPGSVVYPFSSTGAVNLTWSTTVSGVTGSYNYTVFVTLLRLP